MLSYYQYNIQTGYFQIYIAKNTTKNTRNLHNMDYNTQLLNSWACLLVPFLIFFLCFVFYIKNYKYWILKKQQNINISNFYSSCFWVFLHTFPFIKWHKMSCSICKHELIHISSFWKNRYWSCAVIFLLSNY